MVLDSSKGRRQLAYPFVLFSVLNRTWETVKRTGNKEGVSADGKTVVTFVCFLLINSQCRLEDDVFLSERGWGTSRSAALAILLS